MFGLSDWTKERSLKFDIEFTKRHITKLFELLFSEPKGKLHNNSYNEL